MSTQESVVKHSELLSRLVLDRKTTEEVGRVDCLWLNPSSHKVTGFTCKSGFLGGKKRYFPWEQIESIGEHGILVNIVPEAVDPEKSDEAVTLINHEVWTDVGNKVGKVVDFLFVPQTGAVVNYLFVSSGWRGVLDGIYLLSIPDTCSVGSKRIIVEEATFKEPQFYSQGLNQIVSQAKEFIKGDLEETKRHLEAIKRGTQDIAEQAKEKAQAITDRAREQLSEDKAQQQDPALPAAADIIEIKAELVSEDSKEK